MRISASPGPCLEHEGAGRCGSVDRRVQDDRLADAGRTLDQHGELRVAPDGDLDGPGDLGRPPDELVHCPFGRRRSGLLGAGRASRGGPARRRSLPWRRRSPAASRRRRRCDRRRHRRWLGLDRRACDPEDARLVRPEADPEPLATKLAGGPRQLVAGARIDEPDQRVVLGPGARGPRRGGRS